MTLHPTISFEQYRSVLQAVRAESGETKKQWVGVLIGAVIGFVIVCLYIYTPTRMSAYALWAVFILWWAVWCPYVRKRYKTALRKNFDDQELVLNGQEMNIDESGISGVYVGGRATYQFEWKAFYRYIDRAEDILFLYSPCCWIRVPKDQLSAADHSLLLEWYAFAQKSQN